jgi:ABC-type sugar transport system permease subunit
MRAALPAKALPYLLILPALVTLLCLFIYPILWNAYISLHEVDFQTYNRTTLGGPRIIGHCDDSISPLLQVSGSLQFVGGSVLGQFVLASASRR